MAGDGSPGETPVGDGDDSAMVCGETPEGSARWTIRLIVEGAVRRKLVARIPGIEFGLRIPGEGERDSFTPVLAFDNADLPSLVMPERPNLIGNHSAGVRPSGAVVGTVPCRFNPSAFAVPPAGQFGMPDEIF